MRSGKTAKQIEELKQQLDLGKSILVAGLKDSGEYLNRLGEGYEAEPHYMQHSKPIEVTWTDLWTLNAVEYLPTLVGYKFKKL